VLKLPDQPLGLVRQKPDQPVLRFFADPAAEGSVWQVQLGAGDKPGFGLAAADGKLALFVDGATGNVGIGTTTPCAKLQITGNVSITSAEGQNYACKNNFMAAGSLTIGGIDRNYGGGTSWNNNTAGLLLETLDNTEIAIHDSGLRVASFMYYESANNRFTIGRDMGWGAISTVNVQGGLQVSGCFTPSSGKSESNGLLFPKDPGGGSGDAAWLRYYSLSGDACVLEIGIANDPDDYIYLKSSGGAKVDVLRLGDKWRLSGVGDHEANDEWLRMKNIANTAYFGGFAASKFWTVQGQYQQSDLRSKDNIKNLNSALENLINLQGVSFTWKDNPVTFHDDDKESLGLIAQDVDKVFPQLVQSGPDGKLGVNYIGLIPVLVECIKEQQVQIHSLRDQLISHL
jgi:hypothetical protein